MNHVDPFGLPGRWFRGNVHLHSTVSDGNRSPEEVIRFYREQGYHFLAFTEHDTLTEGKNLDRNFITLTGIEVEGLDPVSGMFHLVGLGGTRPPDLRRLEPLSLQEATDRLRATGARVALAHPYWSGQMSKDLIGIDGWFAVEAFNGGCEVDDAKGYSAVHWDDLLAAGRRLWGVAVDDAHWRSGTKDAGLGWVWVKAPSLTQESILSALEQGHFYASAGPEIQDLQWDPVQNLVHVRCSPAVCVDFVGYGWHSRRVSAPSGTTLTEASLRLGSQQRYVRVVCHDAQGRRAWSNPQFLQTEDNRGTG